MPNLYEEVQELKNEVMELSELVKKNMESLKFFQNSPLIVGYSGKRMDLNETVDIAKTLGRITTLESQVTTLEGYH